MPEMTDETRRALTLYLGECWHEFELPNRLGDGNICVRCEKRIGDVYFLRRLFTTPDDMAAVREEIIRRGEWLRFELFAEDEWVESDCPPETTFMQWLTDPETFCRVAGEWVGRKENNNVG